MLGAFFVVDDEGLGDFGAAWPPRVVRGLAVPDDVPWEVVVAVPFPRWLGEVARLEPVPVGHDL